LIGRHGTEDHGAFVVVTHSRAGALREALAQRAIIADARGPYLRLCPDILTTDEEIALRYS
jgi:kynureninase